MKKKKQLPKKMTEKQELFCDLYSKHAGNISKVCFEMNITTARASEYLQQPLVKERLARSVEIARRRIEASAPHLVNLALQMVNSEELNPKIRASLIDSLLDRAGVAQPRVPAVSININTEIQDRARAILAEKLAMANSPALTTIEAKSDEIAAPREKGAETGETVLNKH